VEVQNEVALGTLRVDSTLSHATQAGLALLGRERDRRQEGTKGKPQIFSPARDRGGINKQDAFLL
jgi:hypothetical protein